MSYLKIELLEIGIQGENNEEITMYGIHFRKNEEYEEIFHESKTKIIGLFSYFKAYGILSNQKEDFYCKKEIGSGNFSKVFSVKRKFDKQRFAVKVINKSEMMTKNANKSIIKEISILRHISSPSKTTKNNYCLNMDSIYEGDSNIYIITNLFKGMNQFDFYKESRKEITELDCVKIIKSILEGLAYLQLKGIVHRDIKPANIVIKNEKNIHDLAIIDFGLSAYIEDIEIDNAELDFVVGTPGYVSPEMLRNEIYDYKCDIFSAGCTLYQLLFGKQLFYKKDKDECLELNLQCPVYERITEDIKKNSNHQYEKSVQELLVLMIEPDPKDRLYAHQLLKLPIFKLINDIDEV